MASLHHTIVQAAARNDIEHVSIALLDLRVDVNQTDLHDTTPLSALVRYVTKRSSDGKDGDPKYVFYSKSVQLLLECPKVDVNCGHCEDGVKLPLATYALKHDRADLMELIIQRTDYNINAVDPSNMTLFFCSLQTQLETNTPILRHSGLLNRDDVDYTILPLNENEFEHKPPRPIAAMAVMTLDVEVASKILDHRGVNINETLHNGQRRTNAFLMAMHVFGIEGGRVTGATRAKDDSYATRIAIAKMVMGRDDLDLNAGPPIRSLEERHAPIMKIAMREDRFDIHNLRADNLVEPKYR